MDKIIAEAQRTIPECLAIGVVDMSLGMLLDVKTVDSHPQEILDMVAAATADIYQGPNVTAIEQAFNRSRGVEETDHHYFQEIIVLSDNLLHVFVRSKRNPMIIMVVVCRKNVNLGMALSKSRAAAGKLERVV